jgi:hypothetical protein
MLLEVFPHYLCFCPSQHEKQVRLLTQLPCQLSKDLGRRNAAVKLDVIEVLGSNRIAVIFFDSLS